MKCFDDGMLRAYLDGEMPAEHNCIQEHLRSCAACQARSEALSARANFAGQLLPAVAAPGPAIDVAAAWGRYRQNFASRPKESAGMGQPLFGSWNRSLWGGVAAACLLIGLLSFAPARSWGQKILQMLRVQKVAVVPVNFSTVAETSGRQPGKLIAQLISDNVVVTMDPGKPTAAPSADVASQLAGFKVRTLETVGTPTGISVTNEAAFHMTLDRDRMQAVLDQAGRSDIQIPALADGSTVAVHIPKLARLHYGNCQQHAQGSGPGPQSNSGEESCMIFVQVPSPTVSVPPNLNLATLAEAGLEFTGMSAAEAHSFTQTVDWSSTLVIPVPQSGGSYRPVSIDGVNASLIERAPQGNFRGNYSLVWVKNGIIYSLNGSGNSSRALAAAASLN